MFPTERPKELKNTHKKTTGTIGNAQLSSVLAESQPNFSMKSNYMHLGARGGHAVIWILRVSVENSFVGTSVYFSPGSRSPEPSLPGDAGTRLLARCPSHPASQLRGLGLQFLLSLRGATSLKMLMRISQGSLKIIIKGEMAPSFVHA